MAPARAREELGSTGLGEGFALPHAHIEGLDRFSACSRGSSGRSISTRSTPNPWILVFLLQIPAAAQGERLAALAALSRRLRDKEFAPRLRRASSVAAVCSLPCDPQLS
ncbi:MAG: PTS sugar transporter subunit IIA [Methylocella sp.]